MGLFLLSFWRAVVSCLHPRVWLFSLLPLVAMALLAWLIGFYAWDAAAAWVAQWTGPGSTVGGWLARLPGMGAADGGSIAPVLLVAAVVPLAAVIALVATAAVITPVLTGRVARQYFPHLVRHRGGSFLQSLGWSLGSGAIAFAVLVLSIPLWAIPPLVLVLPPLIWGWLTYRVMAFDVLAEHADPHERRAILRRHRPWLLAMGVVCGYLGAVPGVIGASGLVLAVLFVVLIPLGVWLYTLVLAFSSLWYAHYCLAALQALRAEAGPAVPPPWVAAPAGTTVPGPERIGAPPASIGR